MSPDAARKAATAAAAAKVPGARAVKPTVAPAGPNAVYSFRVPGGPAAPGRPPGVRLVKVTIAPDGRVVKVLVSRG